MRAAHSSRRWYLGEEFQNFPHWTDLFVFGGSDATLTSLESVATESFDTSQFGCVTSALLHDVMQLTFISDEKHALNPLGEENILVIW